MGRRAPPVRWADQRDDLPGIYRAPGELGQAAPGQRDIRDGVIAQTIVHANTAASALRTGEGWRYACMNVCSYWARDASLLIVT